MHATNKALHLQNIPITSGKEAVARSLRKSYPIPARPHPLHLPSVSPEHPFGSTIGGFLMPSISRSSWSHVEPGFREILSAYLNTLGAPPSIMIARAERPRRKRQTYVGL